MEEILRISLIQGEPDCHVGPTGLLAMTRA